MKYISVESKNNKECSKLDFDQYYTSYDDMEYCVNKGWDVLLENGYEISGFVEPSAGAGVFSDYLLNSGLEVIAIDILPQNSNIIQADFLDYELDYKQGRCIIGNPPYGARLNMAQKFYKKSITIGDYIIFILPISQLWNTQSMYEFDLLYSEDLGKLTFSNNKKVHCCLNVYVRPKHALNKKNNLKLNDISIYRQDKKDYENIKEDIRICYWGDGTVGKVLQDDEHYSGEYKIVIHNKNLKEEILNFFNTIDWKKELNSTAMKKIQQFHIIQLLKKYIKDIK
ncbi:MAG: hypothetical protein ACLTDM_11295 [Clostridium butyricum]